MNIEKAVKGILDGYENAKHALAAEYESLLDCRSVNRFGEASAEETLAINDWWDREMKQIREDYIAAIRALDAVIRKETT